MPALQPADNIINAGAEPVADNVLPLPEKEGELKAPEQAAQEGPVVAPALSETSAEPDSGTTGSKAAAILLAAKRVAQNKDAQQTSQSVVLATVILLMTTLPALYIFWVAVQYIGGYGQMHTPGPLTKFIFAYATIKSELFNLFTVAALPTLTAYFGATDSKYREGFLPWVLFTYFLAVFVSTFVPQVVADASYIGTDGPGDWAIKVKAMGADPTAVAAYLTTVRNGAMAGIAVLTGIKLAS